MSSDFEVTVDDHPPELPAAVVARLVDGVVDQVFTGANDLVVDVESMSAIDLEHGGGYVRSALALRANSIVYHTNYFSQAVRLPGSRGVARPAGRPPRGGGAGGSGPGHRR